MINPSGDDFIEQDPLAGSVPAGEEQTGSGEEGKLRQAARRISDNAGEGWEQARAKAVTARERTEFFLRENPVPTILGALCIGLAIGLAIRYASSSEEKEVEVKSPLGSLSWSTLSFPLLWPFFKSMKRKYEDSAETVKEGVDRLKDIDVNRYVKPLRKRWKAWTD